MFHAVIFDLDGTLFDSLIDLGESMNEVLCEQGYPIHPIDSYRYFVGEGMEKLVIRSLPVNESRDQNLVAHCLKRMRTIYGRRWDRGSTLYQGIATLLDGLIARNLSLAIFSNKPQELTSEIHERFLSSWPFRPVLGANSGFPLKPEPDGALAIAEEHSHSPDEILYLGDTAIDMLTARRAGMYPVGCLWGFRDKIELKEAGAQLLLSNPAELLKCLDRKLPL